MKNNNTVVLVVGAIIIAAAAFFGGMKYQESKTPSFGNFQNNANAFRNGRMMGQNGMRFGGRGGAVIGEVVASDDKSITVKLQDGSSKIVLLDSKTTYNKATQASKSDVATGTRVAVFGTPNSDGSVTASNVQLNPMMFRGMMGTPMPTK